MKTIWMTDDELLALATMRPDADHPLILPSLGEKSERTVAQAVDRGIRSLRIRATENDQARWTSTIDQMAELIAHHPVLTSLWLNSRGEPTPRTAVARYHRPSDDRGVIELIYSTGLHSFGLTTIDELSSAIAAAATSAWQNGPEIPDDWPEDPSSPVALLLVTRTGNMIISAGGVRHSTPENPDGLPCSIDELDSFLQSAFDLGHVALA